MKRDGTKRLRQFRGGHGITDDGGGLLQSALPIGLSGVAKDQGIRMKAGGDEQGASQLEEVRPARGDADQGARGSRQPFRKRSRDGANAQREEFGSRRKRMTYGSGLAGKDDGNGTLKRFGEAAIIQSAGLDRKSHGLFYFECDNSPEFVVWLNEQEMIRRLKFQPVAQTGAQGGQRNAQPAGRSKESGDGVVESEGRREREIAFRLPYVNAASPPELDPAVSLELPVTRADGVGMEMKAASQFACAGQTVAGTQVIAQNAENHLSDKLFAERDFGAVSKPKLHGQVL